MRYKGLRRRTVGQITKKARLSDDQAANAASVVFHAHREDQNAVNLMFIEKPWI